MKLQKMVLIGVLLAAFSASAADSKVTRVGDVTLSITSMALPGLGSRDMVMGFAAFRKGTGSAGNVRAQDVCFVTKTAEAGPPGSIPGEPASSKPPADNSLDAGDPLTLRQGAQTYTTLPRRKQGQAISYTTGMQAALKAPTAGLVIDIPGAAGGFPAMKDKAFPVTAPVKLTAPTPDDDITPATTFTWANPSKEASTLVMLTGAQEDKDLFFTCMAVDDGKFNFPAATLAELKQKGLDSGHLMTVGRMSSRTYQEGDALLNIRVMSVQMALGN